MSLWVTANLGPFSRRVVTSGGRGVPWSWRIGLLMVDWRGGVEVVGGRLWRCRKRVFLSPSLIFPLFLSLVFSCAVSLSHSLSHIPLSFSHCSLSLYIQSFSLISHSLFATEEDQAKLIEIFGLNLINVCVTPYVTFYFIQTLLNIPTLLISL